MLQALPGNVWRGDSVLLRFLYVFFLKQPHTSIVTERGDQLKGAPLHRLKQMSSQFRYQNTSADSPPPFN